MLVVRFSLSFLGVHVTRRQTHNELVSFLPDASKTGFSSVNRSATPVLRKRENLQKIALYTTSIQTSEVQLYKKHGFKVVSKGFLSCGNSTTSSGLRVRLRLSARRVASLSKMLA